MGAFHSTKFPLASEPKDDDEEEGELPFPNLQNHKTVLISFTSINKATKSLLQRVWCCFASIFFKPRKTAYQSLLPIQNPTPSPLSQTPPSTSNDSSADSTFEPAFGSSTQEEAGHVSIDVVFPQENYSTHGNETVELLHDEEEGEVQVKSVISVVLVVDEKQKQKQKQKQKEKLKDEEKERKIKHYSSKQKILLVGEGDFSFSACLAVALGSATNIIATSLNSKDFLKKNYGEAANNIEELRSRGGKVMHGIDATEISKHKLLNKLKYDRIVFNFPHAGFFPSLSTELQLRKHRRLVSLFLKNAKEMINGENGEIHITHKTNGSFHAQFNLESIASSHGLRLVEAVKFKLSHYPGYNTKYGFGGDANFDCNPSKTFKFALRTPPY